jgi:hypothetical protein
MSRCAGWAEPFPRTGGAPKRRREHYTALLCGSMGARWLLVVPFLAGCGGRDMVPPDRIEGAIRKLPYEARFRDVEQPSNGKLVAGRLRDPKTKTSIDFSVRVGEGDDPIVPGAAQNQGTGCAGAWVVASEAGRDAAERDRMLGMESKLENAIFDLAPEAYCEG